MADGEDIVRVRLRYNGFFIEALELTTSLGLTHLVDPAGSSSSEWVDASPLSGCPGAPLRLAWIEGTTVENPLGSGSSSEGLYLLSLTLRWAYR